MIVIRGVEARWFYIRLSPDVPEPMMNLTGGPIDDD